MFFRRKKNEDLLKQLNRFIRKIDRAKRELEDIDKEVDRIKVEAENYSNIVKLNKAQMEHTALELFYSTYIREETDLVMMVYALKLGRPLLLTDELAAYIGKTASLLRFACRQGLHFPCFTYDERGDAFLILAEDWEHRAYEQSRDAIRYSLPFRSWLEEDGALAPDEIEQCITALLKAEGLAKSNNLEYHALFDCQQDEPLLTIIGLWTLDAFHDLDRECKGRYAKIYFPLLAKHYKESDKHATTAIFEEQGAAHNGRNETHSGGIRELSARG